MDKSNVWLITAKTNLHVGNENTSSYGLIDLAVQRNVTTGLPCINSSSLKGALNEFASQFDDLDRIKIFGSDKKDKSKKTIKGQYTFFDADILFLPAQNNKTLYHLESSHAVLQRMRERLGSFSIPLPKDDEALVNELKKLLHFDKPVRYEGNDAHFFELCSDENLPIIARNVLEDGESKNLWYEQVIPAEAVFYTLIDDKGDGKLAAKLLADNVLVQIGANATIGYGFCKFDCLK